jgi:acetyltransferase-like isoleucine patch superfamily enzyme
MDVKLEIMWRIHCNSYIAQYTEIEDDVFIAPGVVIANDLHPVCSKCMREPLIKRGVKIGINATLLPLITIREDSLIGAGIVVTQDVPSKSVVCGNPARIIKKIDDLKCVTGVIERPYER